MVKYIDILNKNETHDVVIVGAGISGLTLAERYASIGKRVLVVEQRNHIGGNCHDFVNEHGILVASYGPHYFHTNYDDVWSYVQSFSEWFPYEHKVVAHIEGKKVPVPINRNTINILFGENLKTDKETEEWFLKNREFIENPINAEDAVVSRMGRKLYELIFKGYTSKQWGLHPTELHAEVTNRIPLRYNDDDRYFTDIFQAMPKHGYTKLFEKMADHKNIKIILNTEWDHIKAKILSPEKLFFTGRIDQYFNDKFGVLQYRSLKFDFETHDREFFQEYAQENHPSENIPFTRIVEYKRATGQKHPKTTISHEYPTWDGEPYYPVPSEKNRITYAKYQQAAAQLEKEGVFFVGRLANYKYFNMDQAFKNALDIFLKLESNTSSKSPLQTFDSLKTMYFKIYRKVYFKIKNNYPSLFKFCIKTGKELLRIFYGTKNWYFLHQKSKIERSRFTFVVARYSENVSWLNGLEYNYIIYNKGKNDISSDFKNVISLPNEGREAGTYLDYIINHYDSLPEYMVFLQGRPFDHASNIFKKLNEFDGSVGFLDLSDQIIECDGKVGELLITTNLLFEEKINKFTHGLGAQFLVDRETVLSHSLETYKEMYTHCKKARGIEHLSDKYSPWILERVWTLLFKEKKQTVFDSQN